MATVQTISMTTSIIQQTASRQSLFVSFLVLNNSLILLKRNLLLFATVGNITLLSLCVELSFLYEKMIICKSYVAGNILCEFHTCFLPEDRIYVNSREHVI